MLFWVFFNVVKLPEIFWHNVSCCYLHLSTARQKRQWRSSNDRELLFSELGMKLLDLAVEMMTIDLRSLEIGMA